MSPPRPSMRPIWGLAAAETIGWAGIYYLFAALLLPWERDLGWYRTELSAGLTIGVAVSALAAPPPWR